MNDNVLTTLYVLGFAVYFGWELHKRMNQGPQLVYVPAPPLPPPHRDDGPRAAQDMCRCENCAPPFLQESPAEPQ